MSKQNKKNSIFDRVEKQTNVNEEQIRKLAGKIKPEDLQNERKIRQLIAQVGAMAGVPVSKEKEDQIVNYLVNNKVSLQQMQTMIQMFMQQQKNE